MRPDRGCWNREGTARLPSTPKFKPTPWRQSISGGFYQAAFLAWPFRHNAQAVDQECTINVRWAMPRGFCNGFKMPAEIRSAPCVIWRPLVYRCK
jgi:hypothetical protein